MDEILNQAAKIRFMFNGKVPLVIRATNGVALGGAHHCNPLEALFASTPGLSVAVPSTPKDVKGLIKTALRAEDPVIFLMHKKLSGIREKLAMRTTSFHSERPLRSEQAPMPQSFPTAIHLSQLKRLPRRLKPKESQWKLLICVLSTLSIQRPSIRPFRSMAAW